MNLKYDSMEYLKKQKLPWISYNMCKVLNQEDKNQQKVLLEDLVADPRVSEMLELIKQWPEPPLIRHNDVKHPIHKACLLLDMGLDKSVPEIKELSEKILENQNKDGVLQSLLHVPKSYGGSELPSMGWLMCDYPILLYFLIKVGVEDDDRIKLAAKKLLELTDDNGWRCKGSVEKFRGPGRKEDHCPIGTLSALRVFSLLPEYHEEEAVKNGIDAIFYHWEHAKERKVYMFGMGTDFKKLKYPNSWFEIVYVLSVLRKFKYANEQSAFLEMMEIVRNKQLPDGSFIPESAFNEYKGWDFGQKKLASPTLTLAIWKLFNNID